MGGSWCSSQREAEVDERFAAEVDERGRRRGERERLAPEFPSRVLNWFWEEGGAPRSMIRIQDQDQNIRLKVTDKRGVEERPQLPKIGQIQKGNLAWYVKVVGGRSG